MVGSMPTQAPSGFIGALVALLFPIIGIIVLGFILIQILNFLPKLLNWFNRPKLKSEYEERRKSAMAACPVQLKNKTVVLHYENSSLMKSNLGKIIGYSTIPANSIILPDSNKKAAAMPKNFRILYYVPFQDQIIYDLTLGLLPSLIMDIVFTDAQAKDVTNENVVLKGNSIEPMIGGPYHLLVSQDTPVYQIDFSLRMRQVLALSADYTRVLKDVAENALRLNPAHTASLEREGSEAEIPVNSPLPSNQPQPQEKKGLF